MKEKKIVACVVLGVALVSLITVLVAGFAESTLKLDHDYVKQKIVGGVMLGAVVLGIAFVSVFFANKKHRFAVNLGLAIVLIAYCVASLIGVRFTELGEYSLFTAYLTTTLTLMVSTALTFAAWLYLTLVKKKEESAKTEPESDTKKEQD